MDKIGTHYLQRTSVAAVDSETGYYGLLKSSASQDWFYLFV